MTPAEGLSTIAAAAMGSGVEFFSSVFADAYFHFHVRPEEWKQCLAAHVRDKVFLLWANLPFGLRAAPLLWSRFLP